MKNLGLLDNIGGNPIVPVGSWIGKPDKDVHAVLEFMNPGGSHKDRSVAAMIKKAIENREITDETTVVDYTTGSAGISIAAICRIIGLKAHLVMPEGTTKEREDIIRMFGATLTLTPPDKEADASEKAEIWVAGARKHAETLCAGSPSHYLLNQSENPENKNAFHVLANEVLEWNDGQNIDYFVIASGTTATAIGCAEIFKERSPGTKIVAVDVAKSPSTWATKHKAPFTHSPHRLFGTGAGKASPIAEQGIDLIDVVDKVDDDEAYEFARTLLRKGKSIGPTSAANLITSRRILDKEPGAQIVTVFFDRADRYFSLL